MPCKVGAVLQVIRLLAVAAIQLLPCGTTAPPNAKDKVFRYRSYSHLEEFGDPDPVVLKRIRGTHAINIHQSRIPSVTITYYHESLSITDATICRSQQPFARQRCCVFLDPTLRCRRWWLPGAKEKPITSSRSCERNIQTWWSCGMRRSLGRVLRDGERIPFQLPQTTSKNDENKQQSIDTPARLSGSVILHPTINHGLVGWNFMFGIISGVFKTRGMGIGFSIVCSFWDPT